MSVELRSGVQNCACASCKRHRPYFGLCCCLTFYFVFSVYHLAPLTTPQAVRKAKNLSAGTPASKERPRRYFRLYLPVIVLKTTQHKGNFPEVSRRSAPAHKTSNSRTYQLPALCKGRKLQRAEQPTRHGASHSRQ